MTRQDEIDLALLAIEDVKQQGCLIAYGFRDSASDVASIAVRRWYSSSRRKVNQGDFELRVRDLTKGLVQYLEEDPRPALVHPFMPNYRNLAWKIAEALEAGKEEPELR